jgi:hypothetical protein
MYVHLGGELVVDVRELVAIIDTRRLARTAAAQGLLAAARAGKSGPPPRAVIVTTRGVYASPITPATIAARIRVLGTVGTAGTAKR